MARLWTCGFELQSGTVNVETPSVGGTLAFSTAIARSGGASLRINVAAATGFMRTATSLTDLSTVTYARVYLQVTATLPASGTVSVLRFQNIANSSCGSIVLTAAGKLRLFSANGTQIGVDSATLVAGTWYRVELKLDASTAPGSLDARIDGTSFASGANNAQAPWASTSVGVTTAATVDYYLDDWAHNDATGSFQNSYPGEGRIVYLRPGAAGDANSWVDTAGTAGTANNYTLVSETTPDTTTTMVQANVLNAEDMYRVAPRGVNINDTITVVHVGSHMRSQTTTSTAQWKYQIKKTSGGTVFQSAALLPASTTWKSNAVAAPFLYPITLYQDPDGAAWTPQTLATMQIGQILTVAESLTARRAQITAIWAVIEYVAGNPGAKVVNATVTATRIASTW